VLEWCWSRIDEHTRAGLPDSGNRLIGALRELGFKVDDELAEEIRRGRNFIQADRRTVWTASRCARSTTSSREQEAVEPGKGPGVAPRLEDVARYLKREEPPEIEPLPPRHRGSFGPR